jgi:hypothetical protein
LGNFTLFPWLWHLALYTFLYCLNFLTMYIYCFSWPGKFHS